MAVAVFLTVWHVVWPIVTTVGTVLAATWAVIQAWPYIRRTFAVTDIVASLPEQLAELKAADALKLAAIAEVKSSLDQHIEATRLGSAEWNEMKGDLRQLILTAEEVRHEVKHNGGSSMKDAVARIESAVADIPRKEAP